MKKQLKALLPFFLLLTGIILLSSSSEYNRPPSSITRDKQQAQYPRSTISTQEGAFEKSSRSSSETTETKFCTVCKAYTEPNATDGTLCSVCSSSYVFFGISEVTPLGDGFWLLTIFGLCYAGFIFLHKKRKEALVEDDNI
jgi:hypothetical protein